MSKSSRLQKLVTTADDETHYQFYIFDILVMWMPSRYAQNCVMA
ncbi:BTB/POZ domain-containing protein NPY2-like [Iris pallida]|uniref:BTB/POZ domain-containing protein NPY2-like n=1 Tax=Iris pallida TaxID=29817 RepID=A0AAX6GYW8_IRIPA|nr:BTB/POZ domain-containing protein NPY2-like [Iris pallida]KAJ6833508.1 BTB/POZ domain-containing protein NPY2-like [Iris pallida]